MIKARQHVVPKSNGNWGVQRSGATKASRVFSTQKSAINYGRKVSENQKTCLVVHRKTGTIKAVNNYGSKK